jgi:hypothetical protein
MERIADHAVDITLPLIADYPPQPLFATSTALYVVCHRGIYWPLTGGLDAESYLQRIPLQLLGGGGTMADKGEPTYE